MGWWLSSVHRWRAGALTKESDETDKSGTIAGRKLHGQAAVGRTPDGAG
jgi:hypothetical protein